MRFVFFKVFNLVVHIHELRRADKGEIRRIEKQDKPASLEIAIGDFFNLLLERVIRLEREMGEFFIYLKHSGIIYE